MCMFVCGCWCVGDFDGGGCCFFPPVAAVCMLCVCVLSGTIQIYIYIHVYLNIHTYRYNKRCSELKVMVTPQISRYDVVHCRGKWRVGARWAPTRGNTPPLCYTPPMGVRALCLEKDGCVLRPTSWFPV